jgi:rhodanese-related sulfurtransferase
MPDFRGPHAATVARAVTQRTVDDLLAAARARLTRLSPSEARAAAAEGVAIVDIRSDGERAADGLVPGARFVPRNVLEWRLDPASDHCDPELARRGARVILICNEGYQSSLAASTLRDFGVDATDVIGGFQAWRAAGLPILSPASGRGAAP